MGHHTNLHNFIYSTFHAISHNFKNFFQTKKFKTLFGFLSKKIKVAQPILQTEELLNVLDEIYPSLYVN